MARKRNPNRDLAYELFKKSKGKLTCKAIAEQLNEKESNIKLWRREDKWINKGGAPKGNKNALGNIGQLKHGIYCDESRFRDNKFLSKYLPRSMVNVIEELKSENPLDMLWSNILIQQAKILNMIKQYDEMLHKNWDLVTEEQKLRIEVLKEKLNKDDTPGINNRVQIIDDIDG